MIEIILSLQFSIPNNRTDLTYCKFQLSFEDFEALKYLDLDSTEFFFQTPKIFYRNKIVNRDSYSHAYLFIKVEEEIGLTWLAINYQYHNIPRSYGPFVYTHPTTIKPDKLNYHKIKFLDKNTIQFIPLDSKLIETYDPNNKLFGELQKSR